MKEESLTIVLFYTTLKVTARICQRYSNDYVHSQMRRSGEGGEEVASRVDGGKDIPR